MNSTKPIIVVLYCELFLFCLCFRVLRRLSFNNLLRVGGKKQLKNFYYLVVT